MSELDEKDPTGLPSETEGQPERAFEPEGPVLSNRTVSELKMLLKAAGVPFPKSALKAELVGLAEGLVTSTEADAVPDKAEEPDEYFLSRTCGKVNMPDGRTINLSEGLPADAEKLYENGFPYIKRR